MKENVLKYFKEFKNGTKLMFKEFFNKKTNKKQRANMWTFTRLIIPFITAFLCAITDFFDGRSARKYNSSSEYGKRLDQTADKVFSGMLGISLSILNPIFLITLLGEIIISLVNLSYKAKYHDLNISSTQLGRIKQWPLFITLGLGFISNINPILDIITKIMVIISFALQVTTAGSYILENEKQLNKLNNEEIINPNTLEIDLKENIKEKNKTKSKNERIKELKQYKEELLNKNIEKEKIFKLK